MIIASPSIFKRSERSQESFPSFSMRVARDGLRSRVSCVLWSTSMSLVSARSLLAHTTYDESLGSMIRASRSIFNRSECRQALSSLSMRVAEMHFIAASAACSGAPACLVLVMFFEFIAKCSGASACRQLLLFFKFTPKFVG